MCEEWVIFRAASGSTDKTIILWDVASLRSGKSPVQLGPPLTGHENYVQSVAFSPDGKTLASGSSDNTIILWDVADLRSGKWPVPLGEPLAGHNNAVYSVAFSPDGKTLASGTWDGIIILWNVADLRSGNQKKPAPLGSPLTGHNNAVLSVAFSPDGKTLASGSADNTIILWDVSTPQLPVQLGSPLTGHNNMVYSVAFSPDGKTLASGSGDNTVIRWDINPESWQARACRIANRNLTQAEWKQYLGQYYGDDKYHKTCEELP